MTTETALAQIDQALEDLGVDAFADEDGRVVLFGPSAKAPGCNAHIFPANDGGVLAVRVVTPVGFALDSRDSLLVTVNEWHRTHRWPKLSVDLDGDVLTIVSGMQVPGLELMSRELVATILTTAIATHLEFWAECPLPTHGLDMVEEIERVLAEATVDIRDLGDRPTD